MRIRIEIDVSKLLNEKKIEANDRPWRANRRVQTILKLHENEEAIKWVARGARVKRDIVDESANVVGRVEGFKEVIAGSAIRSKRP